MFCCAAQSRDDASRRDAQRVASPRELEEWDVGRSKPFFTRHRECRCCQIAGDSSHSFVRGWAFHLLLVKLSVAFVEGSVLLLFGFIWCSSSENVVDYIMSLSIIMQWDCNRWGCDKLNVQEPNDDEVLAQLTTFSGVDNNGDGMITEEEFVTFLICETERMRDIDFFTLMQFLWHGTLSFYWAVIKDIKLNQRNQPASKNRYYKGSDSEMYKYYFSHAYTVPTIQASLLFALFSQVPGLVQV